jgi:hypothetical protein
MLTSLFYYFFTLIKKLNLLYILYFKFLIFIIVQLFLILFLEFILFNSSLKFYYTSVVKDIDNLKSSIYAEPNPIYGYSLKKNVKIDEYEINSLGFRSFEFNKKKPKETIRIFIVGGSTTFGSNAGGNQYTFPDILNYILNSNSKSYKFEVINAGVLGYSTWQNKLKVKEIFSYEPDLVFIMDGFTDAVRANDLTHEKIQAFASNNDEELYKMSEVQNSFLKLLIHNSEIVKLIKYLSKKYQQSQSNINIIKETKTKTSNDKLFKEKLDAFKTEINLIDEVNFLIENNIKVVILKNPWIIDAKERYENIKSNTTGNKIIKNIDYNFFIISYKEIYLILDRVCEKFNIHCIDLHKTFQKENDNNIPQKMFSDTFHFNRYGNFLIAKDLSEFIFNNQKNIFYKDILNKPVYSSKFYDKFLKFKTNIGTEFLKNETIILKKVSKPNSLKLTNNKDRFAEGENRYWNFFYFENRIENMVTFEFKEEIKEFYFYPRVLNKGSYVKLYNENKLIFELNGEDNDITGISNYYLVQSDLNLKTVNVVLKNSQLWFRDNINHLFFKVH